MQNTQNMLTKPTKPNPLNETYQTKPTKPNLPYKTYQIKPTKQNILNQTKPTKLNPPNQTKATTGSVVPLAIFFNMIVPVFA